MLMNENFELENCNVLHMLEKIVPSEYKSNVLNYIAGFIQRKILNTKNIYEKIVGCLIRVLDIKKPGFLSCLDNHGQLINTAGTHRNNFIRKVARCFFTLKLNHFAKMKSE